MFYFTRTKRIWSVWLRSGPVIAADSNK